MTFRTLLLSLLLLTTLVACGGNTPQDIYIADENDDGQTVAMTVGDAFQLSLPENRSTGYVWSIVVNDDAILWPSGEPAYEIEGEPMPGAGGRVTFTFEAVGPGAITLELINARPGETAVEPADTFALAVTVTQ
ncbi:protease inhibitor I42 family protein [Promineifilum sp.]|uniref:protease inhibitor I42 family protein n=1 Tax=Promineifilum sp. TaxID=2664178 RepID=UPI0035B2DF78